MCFYGGSNLEKTPLAGTLASEVASMEQEGEVFVPYYIKVGTVESLRQAEKSYLLRDNVPILFGEVTPGKKLGSRCVMDIDGIRKMTEIVDTMGLDGLNDDISFRENQARVFTSNASCPNTWHYDLPKTAWVDPPATRLSYGSDVLAVFKHVAFARVSRSVVSAETRTKFESARMGGIASDVLNPQPASSSKCSIH